MKMKYIVIDYRGLDTPCVFPEWMEHNVAAGGKTVVSAGFVDIYIKTVSQAEDGEDTVAAECYGESVSLKVKSRPEDSRLVTKLFNRY